MRPDPRAHRSVPSPFWPLVTRVLALLATLLVALGCRDAAPSPVPRPPGGTITSLTDADTILVTDLTGTLLAETSGKGEFRGRFAAYPFGVARRDESAESHQYAASPRDDAVALDHMGARFYAPDLGVWTSPEPLAVTGPEKLVTADFAAANPYAYARQSPLLAADRDGHFWHVAIGAAVGALMGGGMEAGRQYFTEGRVSDWGRVGAAAAGGGVAGAITAAVPTAGLASTLGANAGGNVIGGVTERIIASGGKSAGTLGDVAMDAAGSLAGDGVAKGAGAAVGKVTARVRGAGGTRAISTPHGPAVQETSPAALSHLAAAREGRTMYRVGRFNRQETTEAQFWAFQNPATSRNYADDMGLPGDASTPNDWIMGGVLKADAAVVTRKAPGLGANRGGTMEAVTEVGGAERLWFHMPD
jgi:RHS repeat-associated protein